MTDYPVFDNRWSDAMRIAWLENYPKQADIARLLADASKHAHDADTVRRERDKALADLAAERRRAGEAVQTLAAILDVMDREWPQYKNWRENSPEAGAFRQARVILAGFTLGACVDDLPDEVSAELSRAMTKFPTWPTDVLHALAVLGEEFGELTQAALQSVYEPHKAKPDAVRAEAVQTAAMALRFLASVGTYSTRPSAQHLQAIDSRPDHAATDARSVR